jgi:uncharacterized protein YqhQ
MSIKQAFASVEQDQQFNSELRKDKMKLMIETKIGVANAITMACMVFGITVYIFIPVVYAAFKMFNDVQHIPGVGG